VLERIGVDTRQSAGVQNGSLLEEEEEALELGLGFGTLFVGGGCGVCGDSFVGSVSVPQLRRSQARLRVARATNAGARNGEGWI
jgi:hypothetical protein